MPRLSRNRLDMEDGRIDRAALKDWSESALGVSNNLFSGTSYTVDLTNGNVFNVILNADCSFAFANPTASGSSCSFTLILKQDNVGGRTVSWPGAVYWPGGVTPTLASAPGDFDVIEFSTTDGGAKWFGSVVKRNIRGAEFWAWGNASYIPVNNFVSYSSPVQVGALADWAMIRSGGQTTFGVAVKNNGTLWTWGLGTSGRLGLGDTISRSSPVQVGTLSNWATVSCSNALVNAIRLDGTLWTWGGGSNGSDGLNSSVVARSSPVQVGTLTNWRRIASGNQFNLAIKTDGTLWTWGLGTSGCLGINSIVSRSSPVQVGTLSDWSTVYAGTSHATAVKTDGSLWTWGLGTSGRLGLGDTISRSSPVQVGTDTNWAVATTGPSASFAIRTNGTLWAWGEGQEGFLGLNNTLDRLSPTQIGSGSDWIAICAYQEVSLGFGQMQALRNDGTLWAWGNGQDGEHGLNDRSIRSSPVQVGTLNKWRAIAGGGDAGFGLQYP